ncbi:MAG: hypothetical protein HY749_11920 [Gammaproteobacteria bacterium]|nr:hypothetical protein [Gammaproteobacteria bacterium]
MKLWLTLLVALGLGWWLHGGSERQHAPGELAPGEPVQSAPEDDSPRVFKGFTITPLADFAITARVLGRKDYGHDRESQLAPTDLALGWGAMSDTGVLQHLDIGQGGRWYRWSTHELPIPAREIATHSANMHLVPANEDIAEVIGNVRTGDVVTLRGQLIEAAAPDKWRWKSSLSRTDTGGGSCELVWVEEITLAPD